jgi:hypothetical protein
MFGNGILELRQTMNIATRAEFGTTMKQHHNKEKSK